MCLRCACARGCLFSRVSAPSFVGGVAVACYSGVACILLHRQQRLTFGEPICACSLLVAMCPWVVYCSEVLFPPEAKLFLTDARCARSCNLRMFTVWQGNRELANPRVAVVCLHVIAIHSPKRRCHMYVCMCMYVDMHVCMCTYIYIYTYTNINICIYI